MPNLGAWLGARGMSQAEFARRLGIAPNRFNQYINGVRRMPLALAVRIVRVTGIPVESLLARERDRVIAYAPVDLIDKGSAPQAVSA